MKQAKIANVDKYKHTVKYSFNKDTCRNRRSLICEYPGCGMTFNKSWNLLDHARTHTGERPYSCHLCDLRFTQKGNLNKHMKVHSEVSMENRKQFKCDFCDKCYTEKFNLNVSHCSELFLYFIYTVWNISYRFIWKSIKKPWLSLAKRLRGSFQHNLTKTLIKESPEAGVEDQNNLTFFKNIWNKKLDFYPIHLLFSIKMRRHLFIDSCDFF